MPLPLTTDARNALAAREVAHAWLLELFTDEGTLRGWDKPVPITYGGDDFEALGDQWGISGEIRLGADLVPEPLTITFDGAPQNDDASFVGRLLDRSWHQRRMRLRGLLLNVSSNFTTAIGIHLDWNGWMDTISTTDAVGQPAQVILNCEGGVFRALDRNLTLCTHADQQRRSATDTFFKNVALKPQQDVPFGTKWSNIPGANGRGGGGGGGGTNTSVIKSFF
ncbi:MAG TPA: hypothetical protein PLR76_15060 [Hyphomonas sp.]|nr:hypothetical protein [Hyphomonas sp.]